jgi:hypothetical protein
MNMDIEGVGIFALGCFCAGCSALYWKKHKVLHLVPFAYSLVAEIVAGPTQESQVNWGAVLLFGAIYYTVGILAVKASRQV